MKKSFREYHLLNLLNSYDFGHIPLDAHLSNYFRKNQAIGSKDRKEIAEKIYQLIRWMGLVDHHCKDSTDWEERIRILEALSIKKKLKDDTLPSHIRVSFPKALYSLLEDHYGREKTDLLCLASNTPAPTTIRTNVLKTTRQTLYSTWKEKFSVSPTKESVFGIRFDEKINFGALEEFKKGHFEVQDEASQLVANLIEAKPGDQVLDYCAGSGGKTLAFAHKLQGKGQLYLHDIRKRPLLEAKRRLKRAGIENAQILDADASHKEKLKGKMNWVFADVPCTGTGTLRRNPDLKWKFSLEMLEDLIQEQRAIVKECLEYLAPNGNLVYATCSILPQENSFQVAYFQENFDLTLMEKPFQSLPEEGGMDGFFAAILQPTNI